MAVKSIFLQAVIDCPRCSNPLPLNRAATRIVCGSCHSEIDTPVVLWQVLTTEHLLDAVNMEPGEDSWANGMRAGLGSFSLTFGRHDPRCQECDANWNLEQILALSEEEHARFTCTGCGKLWSLRTSPDWFSQVIPGPHLLVGESGAEASEGSLSADTGISIRCYHCGGPLPLDGSSRTVKCEHCSDECIVPDDIWMRLHPVKVAHPWFILVDVGEGVGLLPGDVSGFMDLEGLPGDEVAVLWDGDDDACVARADRRGRLRWMEKDIGCSDSARLFHVPSTKRLWVVDRDEELVLAFDVDTGERLLKITNEEDEAETIRVEDNYNSAALADGTLLVYRDWDGDWYRLRRFDGQGRRVPLWPGRDDADLEEEVPEWEELTDHTAHPPSDALMEVGPDDTLYFIDPETCRFARYDRAGKLLGIVEPKAEIVDEVLDCGINADGSFIIVFDHKKSIGGEDWSHLARVGLDGSFELLVGPFAPVHDHAIGSGVCRISVTPRGTIHVGDEGFDNLRVLNPDGSTLWRSPGTIIEDETLAEELAEARS